MEFHVGDIVRITKRVNPITVDGSWDWVEIMNQTVGMSGKVIEKRRSRTDNEDAYRIYLGPLPDYHTGEFMYSVDSLELETDLDRIGRVTDLRR